MMPGKLKANACITFVLAMLFYLFFQVSKHHPALSQVNAFANDPYDAVGTAGVQFAAFAALLSLVRAFRPYQPNRDVDNQQMLLVRGTYLTCLSVVVTLVADIVAMLRYPFVWIGFPAGYFLAALVGGMTLLTALVIWRIHHTASACKAPSAQLRWARAISISLVSIIILAWYPENWRQSLPGELLTVVMSMILFFAVVWAWGMVLSPSLETSGEDFSDDLASIYRWLKAHAGHFALLLAPLEKTPALPFLHPIVNWLNPRKHRWNAILLVGLYMGVVLALAEAMGEGGLGSHFALLITIFAGLEGVAFLLGYAFLAKPLRLFRHTSEP